MRKTVKAKYLKKNEFRYDTSPNVRRPDGKGHNVYVSGKIGHKAKINVITHSKTFFNEPTTEMIQNPNRSKPDKRKSRFSVPVWENDKYLKRKSEGVWVIHKRDRINIKKFNKKYRKK